MSTFPVSLDSSSNLPNPTGASTQASPDHASLHSVAQTSLIAVETKLGTGSSTPSSTNLLVSTGTGTSAWSKLAPTGTIVGSTDSITLTNKTLTSPTINSPTITNATLSSDAITGFSSSTTGTIYGIGITSGVITGAGTVGSGANVTNGIQAAALAANAITLGYAQITASINTTSTSYVQAVGLTATVTIPAGGRKVKITAACTVYNSTSGQGVNLSIWDGTVGSGTQLTGTFFTSNSSNAQALQTLIAVVTPSAGSKTYNVGYSASANTANINASSILIPFILVEAI